MESLILLALIIGIVSIAVSSSKKKSSRANSQAPQTPMTATTYTNESALVKTAAKNGYIYHKRHCLMTQTEKELFLRLMKIYGSRYLVLPQVHLSSLLDHTHKGQNWKGAFSSINQKSADFVFCSYPDIEPILALEYDDWRHQYREDIQERDSIKDKIFLDAGLPLARIKVQNHLTDRVIVEKLGQFLG